MQYKIHLQNRIPQMLALLYKVIHLAGPGLSWFRSYEFRKVNLLGCATHPMQYLQLLQGLADGAPVVFENIWYNKF